MGKRYNDNYGTTRTSMASRILSTPLAAYATKHHIARMQEALEGADEGLSFPYVEFRRAGTNCDLGVDVARVDNFGARTVDDAGNEWAEYEIRCDVNFPCHGSSDPATVLARVRLYQDVAMLAAELLAEFGANPIWKMTATAQEVAERKAAAEKKALDEKVRSVVLGARSGLRVGATRSLLMNSFDGVPVGRYEVDFDSSKYVLVVGEHLGARGAMISRVATETEERKALAEVSS